VAHKKKVVIPFQLINNLIFIPIKVNGEELTFLLDTGVEETVLFSLDDQEQIKFYHIEKIKLKGLGANEAIDGFKSSKNTLEINGLADDNHTIFLVLDQDINFSSQVGIPVNGIIGYHFFKNHKVEINYQRKKITVYQNDNTRIEKKIKRSFRKDAITIENNKPYLVSTIESNYKPVASKLLLDTGNSDALWIFLDKTNAITKPEKTIEDFLGRGFSGEIFGLRGRIDSFTMSEKTFENPIATFPDATSIKSVQLVADRVGSIGGEILSRFTIVFDYKNNAIYTKPNDKINEPFLFNRSGIEVEHAGLEWIKETYEEKPNQGIKVYDNTTDEKVPTSLNVKFELKPIFKIANIRPNSSAALSGLMKGDKIIEINHKEAHRLTIQSINEMLKSDERKTIEIKVERNSKPLIYEFELKSVL
jgi:hypothetical protein